VFNEKTKHVFCRFFSVMILSGIIMFAPAALSAQDTLPKEKNWEFNLAPFYLWAVNMDGDMTVMAVLISPGILPAYLIFNPGNMCLCFSVTGIWISTSRTEVVRTCSSTI
jgi:hypothetical protein